jgi:succinoglycan biosynthesis protein ExoM
MRIAICIGTYKRCELLGELLAGISRLTFSKEPAPQIEIVVVDNDPSKTAQNVCAAVELRWPVKYVAEERRGITFVRNRAVQEAGDVDFIAFIDDDEMPTPQWLDELLSTQRRFGADVVSGPVVPKFAPGVAEWVKASDLFHRPSFPTGHSLDKCFAGNVLVRREVFLLVPAFDDRFKLSGGEDTQFFLRVRKTGHSIVWSQEAAVHESVPKERANFAWILRRGYQSGNSWPLCESTLDDRLRVRVVRFLKAWVYVAKGAAGALVSLFMGRAALARSLRTVCVGLGMLAGLSGQRFLAYQSAGDGPAAKPPEFSAHGKA